MREIRKKLNRFKSAVQKFQTQATADWVAAFE